MSKRSKEERGGSRKKQCCVDLTVEEVVEPWISVDRSAERVAVEIVEVKSDSAATDAYDEAGELERAVKESLQSEACAKLARGQNEVIEAGLSVAYLGSALAGMLGVLFGCGVWR